MAKIVVCFDHDEKICGHLVIGGLVHFTKESIEKLMPRNCSHYDIVDEKTYNIKYKPIKPMAKTITINVEECPNKELAETAELMVSSDYKDRFKAEYLQLKNRYEGLQRMIAKWDAGTLEFTPTCPRGTYDLQLGAMEDYLNILRNRAIIEHIEL